MPDQNDVDFVQNMKKLLGIDMKNIEALLPKLDPTILIDLADAVNNKRKTEALKLIRIGREKLLQKEVSEDYIVNRKKPDKGKKEKVTLLDDLYDLNVGDEVKVNGKDATVKIPLGPNKTVGVMIAGKLEMVKRNEVDVVREGILGMTNVPNLQRMRELAGIMQGPPQIAPPAVVSSIEQESPKEDEGSAQVLCLLDQVCELLPSLRLCDLKNVRQKITDITAKMNESAYSKPEGRKLKV